jgi:hypothetical protein
MTEHTSREVRPYLREEEAAINAARTAYKEACLALQKECEHRVVLQHTSSNYEEFIVCEDCGDTCIAPWGSALQARGNVSLLSKRSYKVGWTEFARATPAIRLNEHPWNAAPRPLKQRIRNGAE